MINSDAFSLFPYFAISLVSYLTHMSLYVRYLLYPPTSIYFVTVELDWIGTGSGLYFERGLVSASGTTSFTWLGWTDGRDWEWLGLALHLPALV